MRPGSLVEILSLNAPFFQNSEFVLRILSALSPQTRFFYHANDPGLISQHKFSVEEVKMIARHNVSLHRIPPKILMKEILQGKCNNTLLYVYFMQLIRHQKKTVIDAFLKEHPDKSLSSSELMLLSPAERETVSDPRLTPLFTALQKYDDYESSLSFLLKNYKQAKKDPDDELLEKFRLLSTTEEKWEEKLRSLVGEAVKGPLFSFSSIKNHYYSAYWINEFSQIIKKLSFETPEEKMQLIYQPFIDRAHAHHDNKNNLNALLFKMAENESAEIADLIVRQAMWARDQGMQLDHSFGHFDGWDILRELFKIEILSDALKNDIVSYLMNIFPTHSHLRYYLDCLYSTLNALPNEFLIRGHFATVFEQQRKEIDALHQRTDAVDYQPYYDRFFALLNTISEAHDHISAKHEILAFLLKELEKLNSEKAGDKNKEIAFQNLFSAMINFYGDSISSRSFIPLSDEQRIETYIIENFHLYSDRTSKVQLNKQGSTAFATLIHLQKIVLNDENIAAVNQLRFNKNTFSVFRSIFESCSSKHQEKFRSPSYRFALRHLPLVEKFLILSNLLLLDAKELIRVRFSTRPDDNKELIFLAACFGKSYQAHVDFSQPADPHENPCPDLFFDSLPHIPLSSFSIAPDTLSNAAIAGINIIVVSALMEIDTPDYLSKRFTSMLSQLADALRAYSKQKNETQGVFSPQINLVKELDDFFKSSQSLALRQFLYEHKIIESVAFDLHTRITTAPQHTAP